MEQEFDFSPETSSMEQSPTPPAPAPSPIPEHFEPYPQPPAAPPKKKTARGFWLTMGILGTCFALLLCGIGIFAAVQGFLNGADPENPQQNENPSSQGGISVDIPQSNTPSFNYRDDVAEGDALTPQEIIRKVSPSVVTISVQGTAENGQAAAGFGTGIIYTDNGYILTNAHVIEGATKISVTDHMGNVYDATMIGYDSDSDTGVVKINATGLQAAEFGQSSALVPGDTVIAIGTPYDENLSLTATMGIVSALRESLQFPELGYTLDLIQHDAAINSGNSGGPLINIYGQVIGINSIKIAGTYENLGFALQIDDVIPLAEEIMKNGKVSRPGIGITGYSYDDGQMKGAYVYTVVSGGPADKAGLKPGDVIIKAGDKDITTIDELKETLQSGKIGDSVTLTYIRNGSVRTTQLTLEELNAQ